MFARIGPISAVAFLAPTAAPIRVRVSVKKARFKRLCRGIRAPLSNYVRSAADEQAHTSTTK